MTRPRPRGFTRRTTWRAVPYCAGALAALACVAPGAAWAQDVPTGDGTSGSTASSGAPASDALTEGARREQAQQHFLAGVRLASELRWLEAVTELEAARDLRATPPVYFNLAQAYRAVGRYRDAVAAYTQFASLVPPDDAALGPQRVQADRFAAELRDAMPRLTVRAVPATATLSIDGVRVEGREHSLDPGSHVVTLEAPGYRPRTATLTLEAHTTRALDARLEPLDTAARLLVECATPRALIRVDRGAASFGRFDERIAPGRHAVDVTAPGYSAFHRDVVLTPTGSAWVRVTLEPARSVVASPWFWVGSGLGVAAVVAAIVTVVAVTTPAPVGGIGGVVQGIREAPR